MADDLKKIKEEREWLIQQMHEAVNALDFSLGRLSRKLQENIEREKAALIK